MEYKNGMYDLTLQEDIKEIKNSNIDETLCDDNMGFGIMSIFTYNDVSESFASVCFKETVARHHAVCVPLAGYDGCNVANDGDATNADELDAKHFCSLANFSTGHPGTWHCCNRFEA